MPRQQDSQALETAARIGWDTSLAAAPRWATARSDRATFGPAVGKLSSVFGRTPHPAQQYVLDVIEEVDPDTGGPWYEDVLIEMPRRTGKTVLISPLVARRCGASPHQVWLTAQKRDSAVNRWRDATQPLLAHQLGRRWTSVSHERHGWPNGSKFVPFAPNEDTMHGEDPDTVIMDEYWSLDLASAQLIEVGFEAAFSVKHGQVIRMSAAGTEASTALKAARKRGIASLDNPDSRMAYFRWCIPDTVDGRPLDKLSDDALASAIIANHPRVGWGVREDYIRSQIGKDRRGAIRSYGGLDADTSDQDMIIDGVAWLRSRRRDDTIPTDVPVGIGVAVDPEWREAAISVGWRGEDGIARLELLHCEPQTRWAIRRVVDLAERWPGSMIALGRDAGGGDIEDALKDMGFGGRVLSTTAAQRAAAAHRLKSGMEDRHGPTVHHRGERELESAAKAADQRASGEWRAAGTAPITTLMSHTLALWAADHIPEPTQEPDFWVL